MTTVQKPEASRAFLANMTQLRAGMSRSEVQTILGEPVLASENSKIEIYSNHDQQVDVELLVPVIVERSEVVSAILVLYDDGWNLEGYAGDYDVEYLIKDIYIHEMGHTLTMPVLSGQFLVLAPPGRPNERNDELETNNGCRLRVIVPDLIGRPIERVTGVALNGERLFTFGGLYGDNLHHPVRMAEEPLYVELELPQGHHSLSLLTLGVDEGAVDARFDCESGTTLTAQIIAQIDHPKWQFKAFLTGEILISDSWPPFLEGRRILLHHNTWFDN
jgi:hypothetical protein